MRPAVGRSGRVTASVLAAVLVLAPRCANDPAVAPIVGSSSVAVRVRLVDGALAPSGSPVEVAAAPCEAVPTGFPSELTVEILLRAGSGGVTVHRFTVPARRESIELVIDRIAPGTGYVASLEATSGDEIVFTGESAPFTVLSAGRTVVDLALLPVDRRAILALGAASGSGATDYLVPILAANSLPLRGIELDLCYDPDVLETVAAVAAGPRVAGFRGAGGEPGAPGVFRVVLWSEDGVARIAPGQDQVLAIHVRFRTGVPMGQLTRLVFVSALATDAPDAAPFTVYFLDGQVRR